MTSSPSPSIRRRWFQFRLRTLLIFMTLCAIAMGAVSTKFTAARRQRLAVEKIRHDKGAVVYQYDLDGLNEEYSRDFDFWGVPPEDFYFFYSGPEPDGPAWMNSWLGVDSCNTVAIVDFTMNPNGRAIDLSVLVDLPGLQRLRLENLPYATDRLKPIRSLTSLEGIWLNQARPGDIAHLAQIKSLRSLVLDAPTFCDLTPLAQLQSLESLYLYDSRVDDLSPLAGLKNLKTLSVYGTRVSWEIDDLSPLAELPNLKTLHIAHISIANAATLHQFTSLKKLTYHHTALTIDEMRALRAALPSCEITSH